MSNSPVIERNLLVPMRDGVELAIDVVRPAGARRVPAILNFGPYHKDGRGGRLSVDSVHRHFAQLGYAGVSADLRGLGNSGGHSPGAFAPGEGQDGHDLVEWIAAQPWCDGNVGMWGVSYPGITALSTAATNPPHLKAIVPIHASSDLYRGVVALGGTASGFWMRADWGPRMAAYNLMPPLLQDPAGRWAGVWAEHLEGNKPWLEAFVSGRGQIPIQDKQLFEATPIHPKSGSDPEASDIEEFWRSRVVAMERITCPTFAICGWRDLYADCTPRDFAAILAPKKLLMGPWKHEFPDTGKEAPAPGLWDMQRWFERWLKGVDNGIEREASVSLYLQGPAGSWRAEQEWPPARVAPSELFLAGDGSLSAGASSGAGATEYRYDPTVGMYSLAWDPWTTALDPGLPRDHSADDARSLCFTGTGLTEPMELIGVPEAVLDLSVDALPLNLVVKLSAVAPNGCSTLITSGWADLTTRVKVGERSRVLVPLRATAYRLLPGERLRVSVACADFPRVWPTPVPAVLRLFHGTSRIRLPVCPAGAGPSPSPVWGTLQPGVLGSPNDLGGSQGWDITRDLMNDGVRLSSTRSERIRIDAATVLAIDHAYGAAVCAARPSAASMHSTTTVRIEGASAPTELVARTVTTARHAALDVDIRIDGQPFWQRHWLYRSG